MSPRSSAQFSRAFARLDPAVFTDARAIQCLYPDCGFTSRHRLGLKIHRTLVGHALPADRLARGDGPVAEPRVHRGPRTPTVDAEINTDADAETLD